MATPNTTEKPIATTGMHPNHSNDRNLNTDFKNISKNRHTHLNDLTVAPEHRESLSVPFMPTFFPSLTYVVYVHRAVRSLVLTLAFDWTMPIFHPINFLLLVTVVPTIVISLVVIEASLHVAFFFGLGRGINGFSTRWGGGLSPVNWWDPRIFGEEVSEIVQDGIKGLDEPVPNPYPNENRDDPVAGGTLQQRTFNIDIAETCLLMSAIVYERDDTLVRSAHKKILDIADNPEKAVPGAFEEINDDLLKSESRIHQQSTQWGIEFTSLSELNSLGGPFAGMFWSNDHNFVVVVFKGTTPTNFEDFLVDAMIQRVDARNFVFGEVHEGFYTSLFPQSNNAARANLASPYTSIISAIRAKAREIRAASGNPEPVNVWITGHSLGAALGTLFYTRLLKSPEDLGPECVLRDAFLFGTPAIGDADFAAEFAAISHKPFDRHNTLWRVIDDTDIITKLPPGFDDITIRRFINKFNLLNYAHVGEGIRFFQDGRPPVSTRNLFTSGKEPTLIKHQTGDYSLSAMFGWNALSSSHEKGKNDDTLRSKKDVFHANPYRHEEGSPLIFIQRLLPTFFRNHLPIRYFEAMQRARVYFEDEGNNQASPVKVENEGCRF